LRRISNPDIPNEHTITKVAYRGRTFNLEHRRWSEDDALAIKQCFIQAQYDMPTGAHGVLVENLYREIVASGLQSLIIDCGANIGASVTSLAARYPEAHIIAVEPAAENFALLRRLQTRLCLRPPLCSRSISKAPKRTSLTETPAHEPVSSDHPLILEPHDWLMPEPHTSQVFFRFHAASGREFCMKHENVASIVQHSSLLQMTRGLKN
jgi:hypothetical protein